MILPWVDWDEGAASAFRPAAAWAGAVGSKEMFSFEILESRAPGLQLVTAGLTARTLGRLLRRATGVPIANYVVQRDGIESRAILWRVVERL